MSADLHASIKVRLSDDARQQADEVQVISAAWNAFLRSMPDLDLQPFLTITQEREPVVRRRRRGRPPRLAVAEPPPAA